MRRSAAVTRLVLVVLVAPVVLLAACAEGDDDDAVGPTTSATVAPGDVDFCSAFGLLLVGPLAEGGFDPGDPEQLAEAVAVTEASVEALRRSAPAEVAAPAADVADAYAEAFAVLERYGFDLARVDAEATPTEQAVLDAFGRPPAGPGAVDPYDLVEAYVGDRCAPGVTVPPDLTATTAG